MKKTLLIIGMVFAAIFAQAQDNTLEILGHDFSTDYQGHDISIYKVQSMVEKPDGSIVLDNYFRRRIPGTSIMVGVGDGFYSISRQEVSVVDSTFLESNL